jgi:hypothetical protein
LVLAFVVGLGVLARIWRRRRRPRGPVLFSNEEGGKLGSGRTGVMLEVPALGERV